MTADASSRMSGSPIDLVLSRLEGFRLRENGRNRWRACCPAHRSSNPSTLSIGVGDNGAVLLRCWSGCALEDITSVLRLDVLELFPPKSEAGHGGPPVSRRRLVTASQALELLNVEMHLVVLCASAMARGESLNPLTRERLLRSAARVAMLLQEMQT